MIEFILNHYLEIFIASWFLIYGAWILAAIGFEEIESELKGEERRKNPFRKNHRD